MFLKFTHFLAKNRKSVFISLASAIIVLACVIGFFEYRQYLFEKETVTLEDLKLTHQKANVSLDAQIQSLEVFLLKPKYRSYGTSCLERPFQIVCRKR